MKSPLRPTQAIAPARSSVTSPNVFVDGFGRNYGPTWDPGANYELVHVQASGPARPRAPLSGVFDSISGPWLMLAAAGLLWWYWNDIKKVASKRTARANPARRRGIAKLRRKYRHTRVEDHTRNSDWSRR